jgi:hypothetical protein
MTTVRIAHAEPRPGEVGDGRIQIRGFLVVLADDERRRALPLWLQGEPGAHSLWELTSRRGEDIVTAGTREELAARLLQAAGASVTGVDIDAAAADAAELTPETARTRIELAGPAGTRQVEARLGLGLAVAAAASAPVRVADAVLDRLAVPVAGGDLLAQFSDRVPPEGWQPPGHPPRKPKPRPGPPLARLPARRPRFEPRNLSFADGLERWDLDGTFLGPAGGQLGQDYAAAADGATAVLRSAVPDPRGSAALVQTVFADDYRGASVVFRGEIRTDDLTGQAGLRLEILWGKGPQGDTREDHAVTVAGSHDWTAHEIRTLVPEDANVIRIGIGLAGPGVVALRGPELARDA